ADSVTLRDYPKELVPASAVTRIEEVLERYVFIPLSKDDPVLDSKLLARGAGRGLAPLIPKGMRAFTIQTPNVATGVAGFILPGNKVDVLLTVNVEGGGSTRTPPAGRDGQRDRAEPALVDLLQNVETWSWAWKAETRLTGSTTTLLQNVEILAVDQRVD